MRPDVHQAALKAAAKVAFSVVFLNGCAAPLENQEPSAAGEGPGQASAEADLSAKKKTPHHVTKTSVTKNAPDTGATCDASAPPQPVSCDATLAAEFPKPGDYKWQPEPHSKEVVACCIEELKSHQATANYRWDCCVAYDAADPNKKTAGQQDGIGFACTPWGPPVPPSAKRSRRASPEIAAWIRKAVA